MNKAIFIDKDGTLVVNVPFNVDPRQIQLAPFAGESLQKLVSAGYELFVVSNQSGIAHGLFSESALDRVSSRIRELLLEKKVSVREFYFCPHDSQGSVSKYSISCFCRKPNPGLILRAAQEHSISINQSWLIGDILDDIEAGHRAGCRSVMVNNGNETEWLLNSLSTPDLIVAHLGEAAEKILQYDIESAISQVEVR